MGAATHTLDQAMAESIPEPSTEDKAAMVEAVARGALNELGGLSGGPDTEAELERHRRYYDETPHQNRQRIDTVAAGLAVVEEIRWVDTPEQRFGIRSWPVRVVNEDGTTRMRPTSHGADEHLPVVDYVRELIRTKRLPRWDDRLI